MVILIQDEPLLGYWRSTITNTLIIIYPSAFFQDWILFLKVLTLLQAITLWMYLYMLKFESNVNMVI